MLRKAKHSDINSLARIHFLELRNDFLPSLGEKFLRVLYEKLVKSPNTFIFVESVNYKIQGFIAGSTDFNKEFATIIKKNFFDFLFVLITQVLLKPKNFLKILETLFYTKKEGEDKVESELIVIAVLKKYQRKGIGRKLVNILEESFLSYNTDRYKVTVNADNASANKFYLSIGFKKRKSFFLYGKEINLYIKRLT